MAIDERIARATRSKNLRHTEHLGDVDVLTASGLAATKKRLGYLAFRCQHAREVSTLEQLRLTIRKVAVSIARTRRVRAEAGDVMACADAAVMWWLNSVCPRCAGKRFETAQQTLSERSCKSCKGTGRRREPSPKDAKLDWPIYRWNMIFGGVIERLESSVTDYLRDTSRRFRG